MESKRFTALLIAFALIMLGISEQLLWPYSVERWASDRPYGTLHILIAVTIAAIALIALILIFRSIYIANHINWKKSLITTVFIYLVIQLLIAILLGTLGSILYKITQLSYDLVKQILYLCSIGIQNLIRFAIELYMYTCLVGRTIRESLLSIKKPIIVAVLMSVISIALSLLPNMILTELLQIIWDTIYLIVVWKLLKNVTIHNPLE